MSRKDEPEISTVRLPGTGWVVQWRSDGYWRDLNDAQHRDEQSGVHLPAEEDWTRWSATLQPQARGGEWGGVTTWWLIHGELPEDGETPTVVLADGARPVVHLLGRVWACEWQAAAQPLTVHVGGRQFDLPFTEPHYLRFSG